MVDSDQSYYTEPKRDLWALGMIICDMFGKSSNTIVAGMDDLEAANVIVAWLPAGPEPGELDSFEAGEMNSFERDLRAPKAEDFLATSRTSRPPSAWPSSSPSRGLAAGSALLARRTSCCEQVPHPRGLVLLREQRLFTQAGVCAGRFARGGAAAPR